MRPTHVHEFVVEATVEENVARLCGQRAAAMDLAAASVKRGKGGAGHGALTVRCAAGMGRGKGMGGGAGFMA